VWKCKKKVEHADQIPSNHVWNCGKEEILNGIVLMQKWAFLEGKGKVHPCTGTEALYRSYGPKGE